MCEHVDSVVVAGEFLDLLISTFILLFLRVYADSVMQIILSIRCFHCHYLSRLHPTCPQVCLQTCSSRLSLLARITHLRLRHRGRFTPGV